MSVTLPGFSSIVDNFVYSRPYPHPKGIRNLTATHHIVVLTRYREVHVDEVLDYVQQRAEAISDAIGEKKFVSPKGQTLDSILAELPPSLRQRIVQGDNDILAYIAEKSSVNVAQNKRPTSYIHVQSGWARAQQLVKAYAAHAKTFPMKQEWCVRVPYSSTGVPKTVQIRLHKAMPRYLQNQVDEVVEALKNNSPTNFRHIPDTTKQALDDACFFAVNSVLGDVNRDEVLREILSAPNRTLHGGTYGSERN